MTNRRITIFDTTLRDGEQSPGASLFPEEKIRIAKQLAKLGVDVIEPGFPASSPGDFHAVQQISRMLQQTEICGFARAVKADIDAAVKATQDAGRRRLHLFISSSQIHLDFQLKKTREQVLQIAKEMVAYAKQFESNIEFSPMDATRSGEEFLLELIEAAIVEGATMINIPDTMGYALPEEYGALFRKVISGVRGAERAAFSAHCHNDLGMAVANSLAALQAGASQVEVTVNGIGERAGNCSLEELVMAIQTRHNSLSMTTGIRQQQIYDTSRLVSHLMNYPISYNKPIVGRNAFQHESGIHQDGLLKNRNTYEIMDPEKMGIPRSMIVLGKHSGRHALKHRIAQYGIELNDEQLQHFSREFKELADKTKYVSDHEMLEILGSTVERNIEPYQLSDFQVIENANRSRVASATIRDNTTGIEKTYTGAGAGPLEAIIHCIKQAIPLEITFNDLEIHSLSTQESAKGEARVSIEADGQTFRSSAIDRDIIRAAALAFMSACNQAVSCVGKESPSSKEA